MFHWIFFYATFSFVLIDLCGFMFAGYLYVWESYEDMILLLQNTRQEVDYWPWIHVAVFFQACT
jgi:hypothetical protein